MRTFFSSLIGSPANYTRFAASDIDALVEEYLCTPCLAQEEDLLVFWKNNQEKFPQLAKIAPNYLCVPASSAPLEGFLALLEKCFAQQMLFKGQELMFIRCNQ